MKMQLQNRFFRNKYLIIAVLAVIIGLYFSMNVLTKSSKTIRNPELKTIKPDWRGNPLDEDGLFMNQEYLADNSFARVMKWQLETNPQKDEKKNDKFRLKVVNASAFLKDKRDGILWVGHATFLMRIKGTVFITDPIFTVPAFMSKRFSKLPFNPDSLRNIDYILLSHDHYDHLNKESFKLLTKNNPGIKVLTSLRLGEFVEDWMNGNKYQEAGWYQQYSMTPKDIKITYLPARHWSKRGINSMNTTLWGAFMIQTDTLSIYFGGDSGWGSHFKEVKELFGNPDYSIIGIGAYKPEWFMGPSHTSPGDGLKAAMQMSAKNLIPMHYGTFDIADEPIGEPYREVHRIYNEHYSGKFNLITPAIGEVIYF